MYIYIYTHVQTVLGADKLHLMVHGAETRKSSGFGDFDDLGKALTVKAKSAQDASRNNSGP